MFRGICPTEVYDKIMSLKVDKSALDIPRRCIKYAANHIYEAEIFLAISIARNISGKF